MSTKALQQFLLPFNVFLQKEGVTEICVNRPQEIFVEQNGIFERYEMDILTDDYLYSLATLVAEFNDKDFPVSLLSGKLPNGERIQFVLPPACEKSHIVLSIRRHTMRDITLDDYQLNERYFKALNCSDKLVELYQQRDYEGFIKQVVMMKKNIIISGGTGTGKTTFLNACLKCVPACERLITIEDTREVVLKQPNVVHLLFNENDPAISANHLFKTSLRLRPDRIFLSELRGVEAWPFLRAANSGHPGSMTTVHADSPQGVFTQLVFMMQQAGSTLEDSAIRRYIKSVINIVIQLKRIPDPGRFMTVSEIYFDAISA